MNQLRKLIQHFNASSTLLPPANDPIPDPIEAPKGPPIAKPIVPPIIGAAFFKTLVMLLNIPIAYNTN
jgi:hypothetical protein